MTSMLDLNADYVPRTGGEPPSSAWRGLFGG